MRRASITMYAIFLIIIAGLAYVLYIQNREFNEYKQKAQSQIATLKESVKNLKYKFKEKHTKSIQKQKRNSIKKVKQKIPKDAVVIRLPQVPKVTAKVPKVITLGGSPIKEEKNTQLSMEMPLEKEEKKKIVQEKNQTVVKELVGLESLGRVSTYLRAPLKGDPKEELKKAGFTILGVEKLGDNLESIVFTNSLLEKLAKKSPFSANLRVLIDSKKKILSVQNPIYFAKAFMQDRYDEERIKKVLKGINSAFDNLKTSKDKLKASLLPKYQFMFGMPYYKDMITVAKASNSEQLLSRIDGKRVIFKQKIDKESYILGVNLHNEQFIHKIGIKNANLLPYPIFIQGGVAKILDPKYYIAISYPLLKMSQFMSISSTPDEIEQDIRNLFK